MRHAELKYRPDIDGLRAVAVVLVVLFHLQVRQLPGGFVGVDVFFVISGYLLTAIIVKEIAAKRFSIAGFYERRARRILPALFAVLIPTTLLALVYLLPGELVAYAKSLLSATFSYSNFYFLSTADYFDAPAQSKPLLHTWSLAVEEQFYVVLPLLLIAAAKFAPRLRNAIVVGLTCISFGVSVWASFESPSAAFYLPLSRAWELLFGSILAMNVIPAFTRRWMREAAAASGIALIALAALRLTNATPFPGFAGLLPCGGALLVIAAGRHGTSLAGKALSLKPMTFIGLISYSVYLWHWPLIVFTKMGFLPILSHKLYVPALVALAFACGTLSWQFVEKPFRSGAFRRLSRNGIFGVSAGAMAVSAAASVVLIATSGVQSRFPGNAVKIAEIMNVPQEMQLGRCFITTKYRFEDFRKDLCMQTNTGKKNYLLLGDSHAAALWYGLSHQLPTAHILQANVSGCNPSLGASNGRDCRKLLAYVFGEFLPAHHVDGIFLTARWWTERQFDDLESTVAWCRQHKLAVTIFGPVMEYDTPLPKLLAYSLAFHDAGLVERHARPAMFAMNRAVRDKARHDWHIPFISLMDLQCPAGTCTHFADTNNAVALLDDDNHLSNAGSLLMIEKVVAGHQLPGLATLATLGPPRKMPLFSSAAAASPHVRSTHDSGRE